VTAVKPEYLKLDRSLIRGIDRNPEQAALVGALVGYADRVGSLLVAEGVETAQELEALLQLRVPLVQGFHLARPGRPWQVPTVALSRLRHAPDPASPPPPTQLAPATSSRPVPTSLASHTRRSPRVVASAAPPLSAS